jgi:hypothetical protein
VYVHPHATERNATLLGAATTAPPGPDFTIPPVATPDGSPPSFLALLPELDRGMRYMASDSTDYCFVHPGLRVADSGDKGLGVFAAVPFTKGQMVEVAPALVIPDVASRIHRTGDTELKANVLIDYVYPFPSPASPPPPHPVNIVVLGFGMIYNHCDEGEANLGWDIVKLPASMVRKSSHGLTSYAVAFQAKRDIQAGEEFCWDYGRPYWEARENATTT